MRLPILDPLLDGEPATIQTFDEEEVGIRIDRQRVPASVSASVKGETRVETIMRDGTTRGLSLNPGGYGEFEQSCS